MVRKGSIPASLGRGVPQQDEVSFTGGNDSVPLPLPKGEVRMVLSDYPNPVNGDFREKPDFPIFSVHPAWKF
jgi:hypothetical protein